MGYTKYTEDINDRFIDDMFLKHKNDFDKNVIDKLLDVKQDENLEEMFSNIIYRIKNIESWIEFNSKVKPIFRNTNICNLLSQQNSYLNSKLNMYYDEYYDDRFEKYTKLNKYSMVSSNPNFIKELKLEFLKTINEECKGLTNKGLNDAKIIRDLYKDIRLLLVSEYSILEEDMRIKSIVAFVREMMLKESNIKYITCKRCSKSTYEDFKICVHCNQSMESDKNV